MLNVALLGCGRIGQMHATNIVIHDKTQLVGVYDAIPNAAKTISERYQTKCYQSIDEILHSDEVDAVIIASPTDTHIELITSAVNHNKPVLCEKPIDLSLKRVVEGFEQIKNASVPIQIGFNRRFDPGHRQARQVLLDGKIGKLNQVVITSRDPSMPSDEYYKSAGGLFRDMTIHDFDLARFMLDEEPEYVFATGSRLIKPTLMDELNDYDSAMIVMTTKSGKQCHINNSRCAVYGYDQRVELLGSDGMTISDNCRAHQTKTYSKQYTEAGAPYQFFFIERYQAAFMAQIDAFANSIINNTETEVGFTDGKQALVLAEAAYLSLKEKRLVHIDEVTW